MVSLSSNGTNVRASTARAFADSPTLVRLSATANQARKTGMGTRRHHEAAKQRMADRQRRDPQAFREAQAKAARAADLAKRARGPEMYRALQRRGWEAVVKTKGYAAAIKQVRRAAEQARKRRLAHPSRGEQRLHAILADLGYVLTRDAERIDYRERLNAEAISAGSQLAVVEAGWGRWTVDVLIPHLRLVLEIDGFWHTTRVWEDPMRDQSLIADHLRVVHWTEAEILDSVAPSRVRAALDAEPI